MIKYIVKNIVGVYLCSGLDFYDNKTYNGVAERIGVPVYELHKTDLQKNREELKKLPPTELGSFQRVTIWTSLYTRC